MIQDKNRIKIIIEQLVFYYDPRLEDLYSLTHIPQDYKEEQTNYIRGFEILIIELVGKFKLGQNRSAVDQEGLIIGLANQADHSFKMLFNFIEKQKNRKEAKA